MTNKTKQPVDPAVSAFMSAIGKKGGLRRTKKKILAGRKNVRKAFRVAQARAKKKKS